MDTAPATYTFEFDFTSDAQRAVLTTLQEQGYSLLAFRSVYSWENEVQQIPIWLLASFNDIFGVFRLTYTSTYKAYVTQQDVLGAEAARQAGLEAEVEKSFALSNVVPLGTSLVFQQNGSFTLDDRPAPARAISLRNEATVSSRTMLTGLAASVGGVYHPFSAAPSYPTTIVTTTPVNNLIIGVARLHVADGPLIVNTFAPGVLQHLLAAQSFTYKLKIEADTFAVVSTNSTTTTIPASVMSQLAIGS